MEETVKIEFLLAYDDHTWDTEIFNVPIKYRYDDELINWWLREYGNSIQYRKVVLPAVYNIEPDEE